MRSLIARFGVVLVPVMALLASLAPPAHALTYTGLVVEGTATTSAGFGGPCLGNSTPGPGGVGVPSVDTTKCPVIGTTTNTVGITFGGDAVIAEAKVNKAKCTITTIACASVGVYAFGGSGTVSGVCGLANGTGTGSITPIAPTNPPVGTKSATAGTEAFNFSFTGVGPVLVVSVTAAREGTLVGPVVVVQLPSQGTCADKSAKGYVIAGVLAGVNLN